jgi:hypothetical protein
LYEKTRKNPPKKYLKKKKSWQDSLVAGVVDTAEKFIGGVVDTGEQFFGGVNFRLFDYF